MVNSLFFVNILNIISSYYLPIMAWLAIIVVSISLLFYLYLINGLKTFRKIVKESSNEDVVQRRIYIINDKLKNAKVNKLLKQSWNSFFVESNSEKSEILPDPLDYFFENQLVFKAGHRKIIEAIPAMFVSLGILGTFWGITSGISDIDSNAGSEGLHDGINTLLSGMKFAFYSSIAGIVISLIYQLLDRSILYRMLTSEVDKFLNELAVTFPLESEVSFLDKMVKSQEEQVNSMRSFFTDEILPKLTTGISEAVSSSLSPHLVKSNEIMEEVSKSTKEAQSDTLNEMVNHFVESLNQVTGDHLENLSKALENTVEWQERVHAEMNQLVDKLTNAADQQAEMAENTTELSDQMNKYTVTLSEYQENLAVTTGELNELTKQNKVMLQNMGESFDGLDNVIGQISNLGETMFNLQEETKLTTEMLNNATISMNENIDNNQKLNESLISQHKLSNEWNTKTHELLEDVAHNSEMSESIQNNLEKLYSIITEERQLLDTKQKEYNNTITNSIDSLNQYWKENRELLLNNEERFSELNSVLSKSMNDFAEHMHQGVQNTFEQFDVELKKAVEYLERGVSGIQIVVESMEQDLENVNGQITKFNHSIEKLASDVQVSGEVNV